MKASLKVLVANFVLGIAALTAHTTQASLLKNADFVTLDTAKPTLPAEWRVDGQATEIALDTLRQRSKTPSLRVVFKEGAPYAGVVQRIPIEAVRSKTFRAQSFIDRQGEGAAVGIWVRAFDKERKSIAYANSYETKQGVAGAWTAHRLELAIPASAEFVMFGASIYEKDGTMWLDAIEVSVL
jgi:hypothetical protein